MGDPIVLRWPPTGVRAEESLFVPVWVAGQGGLRTPTWGLEPKLGTVSAKRPCFMPQADLALLVTHSPQFSTNL